MCEEMLRESDLEAESAVLLAESKGRGAVTDDVK